jgi:hypothetical protein
VRFPIAYVTAHKVHLLFQVPVVKNHAHREEIRLVQWVLKEITGGRNVVARDRFYGRQIKRNAMKMRVHSGDFHAKQASRAADVAKRLAFHAQFSHSCTVRD